MGANSQGAFADYVVVDKNQLAKIPNSMSYNLGALLEPLGIGLHAVNLIAPKSTESVAIIGAGSIGLCLMSILRKLGFEEIYITDKLDYRVQFAKKMGATEAFLSKNTVDGIKKITTNTGAMYVFDTAGTQDSISACVDIVGISGTIGLIGIPTTDYIEYNPHKLRTKEVILQNVRRANQTLHDCVKLYSQNSDIEKIVTHEFRFEEIQKAFDLVSKCDDNVIKCVIRNN
jgi:threonine dehydrogenase-like Zn-dependent dehydrogenase